MTAASGLAGGATAAILVAGLGNPATLDAARELERETGSHLLADVAGFVGWDLSGIADERAWGVVIQLAALVVLTGLLAAVAGRARSRAAAFLGGWGAIVGAAALAGIARHVYLQAVVAPEAAPAAPYLDGLAARAEAGAAFGLWTGWLVGLAVVATVRPTPVPRPGAAPRGAPAPVAGRPTAPLPPPGTAAWPPPADLPVRPGASVFDPDATAPGTPAPHSGDSRARRWPDDTLVAGEPPPAAPSAGPGAPATLPAGRPRRRAADGRDLPDEPDDERA